MKIFFTALFMLSWPTPMRGLDLITKELPPAVIHRPYAPEPLVVQGCGVCADNGVTFRLAFGALPEGVRLTPAGYFQGIPKKEGSYFFIVQAANSCQRTRRGYTLRVGGAPILVASESSFEFFHTTGAVMPAPKTFHIAANWHDMPYQCDAGGANWLDWRPMRGRTPPEGSPLQGDPVDVYIIPDKLVSGVYRAPLRCTAWGATRDVTVMVTLSVEATEVKSDVRYQ
ncbi:MAG: hypothetical protein HY820_35465 [Acidobacteria bacterium]|nr:hypothetical protein [Acidobacteriota bacterium]